MASLRELERDGLSGFEPDWDGYTGRAYRCRVQAKSGGKARSWFIGLWFERAGDCDHFRSLINRSDWRSAVSSPLGAEDDEVSVEVVYKDFEEGRPTGRIAVLKGASYPVRIRRVRGGESRPTVQWTRCETYDNPERHPAPSRSDLFRAEVGSGTKWFVFVWEDGEKGGGWRFQASLVEQEHKDLIVSALQRQGRDVFVYERPERK